MGRAPSRSPKENEIPMPEPMSSPSPAPATGVAPMAPRPAYVPREGAPIRRSDTSRCRTPGCTKYHDFFQFHGKYYCLECYETLRQAAKLKDLETR